MPFARWLLVAFALLGLSPTVRAGLYYSGETQAELPSQWRGFLLDQRTLRQIAQVTGGQYFAAPTAQDLQAVYRDIGSRIGYIEEPREVTASFAAAGAVLLVAGGALSLIWLNRFP